MKKEITYRELKRLAINFLKENNAYNQFKNALLQQKIQKNGRNLYQCLDVMANNNVEKIANNPEELINFSFTWSYTKENHDFWEHLDCKWRKLIRKENIKIRHEKIFETRGSNRNSD